MMRMATCLTGEESPSHRVKSTVEAMSPAAPGLGRP